MQKVPPATCCPRCAVEQQNDCDVFNAGNDVGSQMQLCGIECMQMGWTQGPLPYLEVVSVCCHSWLCQCCGFLIL